SVILVGRFPLIDKDLRDYAAAYLGSKFRLERVRVGYWDVRGQPSDLWDIVAQITGGIPVRSHLEEIAERLAGTQPLFLEGNCNDSPLDRGFILYRATRLDAAGNAADEFPALAIAPGKQPADLEHYAQLRENVRSATELFKQLPTQDSLNQTRVKLQAALAINPAHSEALRLGADFYKRYDDHKTAMALLTVLAQTDPSNAGLLAELGHEQLA